MHTRHGNTGIRLPLLIGMLLVGVTASFMTFGVATSAEPPAVQKNDDAAKLFAAKCASCHTIGEGDAVGPDLAKVAAEPGEDIATSIMGMNQYVEGLKPGEVKILAKLLKDANARARVQAAKAGTAPPSADTAVPTLSPAQRRAAKLFTGKCAQCHTIGNGKTVGPDLTEVVNWTDKDLTTAVKGMADFAGGPIKDDEIADLLVLLKDAHAKQVLAAASGTLKPSPVKPTTPAAGSPGKSGTAPAGAGSGLPIFQQRCASCHTIGKGALVGPDLAGEAGKPDAVIASNIQRMSRFAGNISDGDVKALVALLKTPGVKTQATAPTLPVVPSAPVTGSATQVFQQKCANCHTIGKGKLMGPDLVVVAKMSETDLMTRIQGMQAYTGTLPPETVSALVQLLKDPTAGKQVAGTPMTPRKPLIRKPSAPAVAEEAPSVEIGRALFTGQRLLQNGGMACIGCHTAEGHGGTLGPNLRRALYHLNDAVLLKVCASPHVDAMKAAYREHPITHQEALHLAKYFSSLKHLQQDMWGDMLPYLIGIFGTSVLVFLLLLLALRRRQSLSGTVEEELAPTSASA